MSDPEFNLNDILITALKDRFLVEVGTIRAMRMTAAINKLSKLEPTDIVGTAWSDVIVEAASYFHNLHELFYSDDSEYAAAINEGVRVNGFNNIPFIDYNRASNITYNNNLVDESTNCINDLGRTFDAKPVYNSDNKETMKLSAIIAKKSRVSESTMEEVDYV